MISAFGVEHTLSKKDKDRAEHYGRMSGAMAGLAGAAGTVGTGSGIVGLAEHKGKDPMGFTARPQGKKPLSPKARAKVLKPMAAAHGWQARSLGGMALAGGGLSLAYKKKQKKELAKAETKKARRKRVAGDTALAAGSAGVSGAAMVHGGKFAHHLSGQANDATAEARASHSALSAEKHGIIDLEPGERNWHKANRRLGVRVAAVKKPAAVLAAGAGAAGGAGLYELGRYRAKKLRNKR